MLKKLLGKLPASTKIKFLKEFIPVLGNIVAAGYTGYELQEGEVDFCTTIFEINRGQPGAKVLAQVCAIDAKGNVVRSKIKVYDLAALAAGLNLEPEETPGEQLTEEEYYKLDE